jgi:hypothetical protein
MGDFFATLPLIPINKSVSAATEKAAIFREYFILEEPGVKDGDR